MKKLDLSKYTHYNPQKIDLKWKSKPFSLKKTKTEDSVFSILMPPPNITAQLHMGHALNNHIQDFMIRLQILHQKDVLWVPGIDHAGIATQNAVEKYIYKEKRKTRHDLNKKEFLEEITKWKDKYADIIKNQLQSMGLLCNWEKFNFTMDPQFSKAVRYAFLKFYYGSSSKKEKLIYQGYYLVNWCPKCQTALSDEEVEYQEKADDYLYYIRYPFFNEDIKDYKNINWDQVKFLTVATTRPETIIGDTALATQNQAYLSKEVLIPLSNERIPVIQDKSVKEDFGTGILKITPAHDFTDFEIGHRHQIPFISILDKKAYIDLFSPLLNEDKEYKTQLGRIFSKSRNFKGSFFEKYHQKDRFEVRKLIVEDLELYGFLEKKEKYKHSVGTCYRCHTITEFSFTKQWFLKMKPLAEPLLKKDKKSQFKNHIQIEPLQYHSVYLNWLRNIQDWCLSRQIWWGHPIPVWYCLDCNAINLPLLETYMTDPSLCQQCSSSRLKQEEDVLDTWFSSMLWPMAVFGWPDKTDFPGDSRYITDFLSTGSEIIYFWVARMIMASLYFLDRMPFKYVYIHPTVCDKQGRKMSKSLGNGIDPLEVIQVYSIDIMRFVLHYSMVEAKPVCLDKKDFNIGRRFADKIWNASRFILTQVASLKDQEKTILNWDDFLQSLKNEQFISANNVDFLDYHIFHKVLVFYKKLMKNDFNILNILNLRSFYNFIFHDFCDLYLEWIKVKIQKTGIENNIFSLSYLVFSMTYILIILYLVMPNLSQELLFDLWDYLGPFISSKQMYSHNKNIEDDILSFYMHFFIEKSKKMQSFTLKKEEEFKTLSDLLTHIFKTLRMLDQKLNLGRILKSPETELKIFVHHESSHYFESLFDYYDKFNFWSSFLRWPSNISFSISFDKKQKNEYIEIWVSRGYSIFLKKKQNQDFDFLITISQILNKSLEHVESRLDVVENRLRNRKFVKASFDSIKKREILENHYKELKELHQNYVELGVNIENIENYLKKT